MKRALLSFSLLSLPLVMLVSTVMATTYAELSFEAMVEKSELAFYGTVTTVEVEEREGEPWTVVTFAVSEGLKGELGESYAMSFYGGQASAELNWMVTAMPRFTPGETVIVLAYEAPYYSSIVGFNQGLWRLGTRGFEDERGRLLSLNEAGEPVLDGEGASNEDVLAALRERLGRF